MNTATDGCRFCGHQHKQNNTFIGGGSNIVKFPKGVTA